jgi:hypothetical protein
MKMQGLKPGGAGRMYIMKGRSGIQRFGMELGCIYHNIGQ